MRRVCAVLVLTIAGLIPLLRYQPSTAAHSGTTVQASAPAQAGPDSSQAGAQAGTTPPANSSTPAPSRQKTVDGSTVETEFGPYQVQVVFTGNTITDVQLITEPDDRHSQRIAEEAAPTLRQEVLQAQSAHIDTVSGATTTSAAYGQSLQAAIDGKGS